MLLLELVPIIIAVALQVGAKMRCLCDNIAVVFAVNKDTAKDPQLIKLPATYSGVQCLISPCWPNMSQGKKMHQQMHCCSALTPQVDPVPTGIPICLQQLTLNRSFRCTSARWKQLFSPTLEIASLLLPKLPTRPLSGDTWGSVRQQT